MPSQKRDASTARFTIDADMLPTDNLIFCYMFENPALFRRIIQAVVGKNEKVELTEPPLSQVAYRNPELTKEKKTRLGTVRVDVQADGLSKLYSLDMQRQYNKTIILKRVMFYSFRLYTSQTVEKMRYDQLKPACVTFMMADSQDGEKKHERHRITVCDETTGEKYYDILDSYLVFVPSVIKGGKNKRGDLYVFSSFFAVKNQGQANKFEQDYGAEPLGKEMIRLYAEAVRIKQRLEDLRNYNQFFTEKEYEQKVMEMELEFNKERRETEKQQRETKKLLEESERQRQESERQRQETEKQRQESEKQRQESERQRQETEKLLQETERRAREQQLESAAKFVLSGMDISVVSENMNVPVPDIEDYCSKLPAALK